MIYELLALFEEYKNYVQKTYFKNWRENWEEYYTFNGFMEWLKERTFSTTKQPNGEGDK